jgi:hypothetical protein
MGTNLRKRTCLRDRPGSGAGNTPLENSFHLTPPGHPPETNSPAPECRVVPSPSSGELRHYFPDLIHRLSLTTPSRKGSRSLRQSSRWNRFVAARIRCGGRGRSAVHLVRRQVRAFRGKPARVVATLERVGNHFANPKSFRIQCFRKNRRVVATLPRTTERGPGSFSAPLLRTGLECRPFAPSHPPPDTSVGRREIEKSRQGGVFSISRCPQGERGGESHGWKR